MTCPRCNTENKLNPEASQNDQFCWKCNGPLSQAEVERMAKMRLQWELDKKNYAAIRQQQ